MKLQEAIKHIEETFGPYQYSGATSFVWRLGRCVLKVTTLSREELTIQRRLQRTQDPNIAQIYDMFVVGFHKDAWNKTHFTVLILQEYVSPDERVMEESETWPMGFGAPMSWSYGGMEFFQYDAHKYNQVRKRWVDTNMIMMTECKRNPLPVAA